MFKKFTFTFLGILFITVFACKNNETSMEDDAEITVYNSLGNTSQDLYAASHVLKRALEQGVGQTVAF